MSSTKYSALLTFGLAVSMIAVSIALPTTLSSDADRNLDKCYTAAQALPENRNENPRNMLHLQRVRIGTDPLLPISTTNSFIVPATADHQPKLNCTAIFLGV